MGKKLRFLTAQFFGCLAKPSLQKIGGSKATAQFFGTLIQGINATKNSWEQSDMSIFIKESNLSAHCQRHLMTRAHHPHKPYQTLPHIHTLQSHMGVPLNQTEPTQF